MGVGVPAPPASGPLYACRGVQGHPVGSPKQASWHQARQETPLTVSVTTRRSRPPRPCQLPSPSICPLMAYLAKPDPKHLSPCRSTPPPPAPTPCFPELSPTRRLPRTIALSPAWPLALPLSIRPGSRGLWSDGARHDHDRGPPCTPPDNAPHPAGGGSRCVWGGGMGVTGGWGKEGRAGTCCRRGSFVSSGPGGADPSQLSRVS
jgi:hypothetical protein